ncbi:ERF family protein [Desulforamulus hydrothermalis]|uniref:ERF family protein n=1 Tax=Desulforamulus hydrothermalis Lam5 = DSM 18033 TaxID=1121428 RepID=K8E9J6_9FIRM|nr:ERF family protein [Desulforamulus hydrothermalis]CCO08248.1 conserved hypothetical protein [Desulforamulus hydrothermalis Lam5 = DSM 18033]SHH43682.1 ERF superfamily protein [Desulforamulus hydrothermalis Lam5 = DSM 18033]
MSILNPERKNIAAKLVQVAKACGYVQKDSENKEQRYKYVSAAAVMEKVNPALVEARLISVPKFSVVSEKEKSTTKGAVWQLVTVECQLTIIDADSGEFVSVISLGTGTDPGDKAVAKAQTMALKYAWLTALNIETGDEPEADERTDKTEFTVHQPVNGGIPNSPRYQELIGLWRQMGWDINSLPGYLEQRFHKPLSHLTEPELSAMVHEAQGYLQQRMV